PAICCRVLSVPTRRSSDLLIDRSVTFEDADGKLLAAHDGRGRDAVRDQTLQQSQSPEASFQALERAGLLAELRAATEPVRVPARSEEHTSELQSPDHLVCR